MRERKKERDREHCGILEKEEEGKRKRCIKEIREKGKGRIEVETLAYIYNSKLAILIPCKIWI